MGCSTRAVAEVPSIAASLTVALSLKELQKWLCDLMGS